MMIHNFINQTFMYGHIVGFISEFVTLDWMFDYSFYFVDIFSRSKAFAMNS